MLRILARVAAAAGLAAAAYVAVPLAPASATGCPTAHGVTVVVDFHELGGGVQTACVADGGGRTAADLFPTAGFPLDYVQRQPGFVCRVSGKPADDPCVSTPPADAYWGLFWSDGKSGSWTYATTGAGGQHVPDGGYVAFSWNGSDGRAAPGYTPAPHPSASPTPAPTHAPSHAPSHAPGQTAVPAAGASSAAPSASMTPSASASASGSASASAAPSRKGRARPAGHVSHSPEPSGSAAPSDAPSDAPATAPVAAEPVGPTDTGLPGWVAPVVIVVLFGAAGAVAVVRRRGAA